MRIYTSKSEALDFCKSCFPKDEDTAFDLYGNIGDGPYDRGNCFGYDEEHPDYESLDTPYECESCGNTLTKEDD